MLVSMRMRVPHGGFARVALMHGASVEPNHLAAITFEEVARVVVDPHRRKRAVQLAIVMALVEGDPSDATARSVKALASALDIPEQGLRVLYDMSHGHAMAARFEMLRRIRSFAQGVDGFPGFRKLALSLLGIGGEARACGALSFARGLRGRQLRACVLRPHRR
jgi:hypothetical protein